MPKLINSACSWLLIAVYKQIITKFLVIQGGEIHNGKDISCQTLSEYKAQLRGEQT